MFKPPLTGPWGKPLHHVSTKLEILPGSDVPDPLAAATSLIQDNAGAITQFVLQQRRNVEAGIVSVNKARMSLDGVDVVYQNQFGHETLIYTAYPVNTPPVSEPVPELTTPGIPEVNPFYTLAVEFLDGNT